MQRFRNTMLAATCLAGTLITPALKAQDEEGAQAELVAPGDARISLEIPSDYRAEYTSAFAKNGRFTLLAHKTGDGKTLMLADIIPMADNVIASQRHIDLPTMRMKFGAGPYLAWGMEFVVNGAAPNGQAWTRVPIGPGQAKSGAGAVAHGGYFSDMFSPLLASLMPQPVGSVFALPANYPKADETFAVQLDTIEVLERKLLVLGEGISCTCWKIRKRSGDGSVEHIWVDRKAPYVFKRVRNPGTEREFVSELLAFETLD